MNKKKKFSPLNFLSIGGSKILGFFSTILALSLVIYSGYVIWDSLYTEHAAYATWDLMQYKPVFKENEKPSLAEMEAVNPDTVAWLTVDDTNIDYPVVQGRDDLEYSNKDIYGKVSLTGSIYLTYANNNNFSDPYSLIYGHHMDNGAMFGDISKFKEKEYFDAHKHGILISDDAVYDLEFFAVAKTHAYDSVVYAVKNLHSGVPELIDYIKTIALQYRDPGEAEKIVALSTCADESTYGRHVLFAKMIPKTNLIEIEDIEPPKSGMQVFGHGIKDRWALLNLICLICTIYIFIPLHALLSKFKRKKRTKKINEYLEEDDSEEYLDEEKDNNQEEKSADEQNNKEEFYPFKKIRRRFWIGIILECIISIIAFILFVLTEDIRLPMTVIDKWTPWMILLFMLCWVVDICLIRISIKPDILQFANDDGSVRWNEKEIIIETEEEQLCFRKK